MESVLLILVALVMLAYICGQVAVIVLLVKYSEMISEIWPAVKKSAKLVECVLDECGDNLGQSIKDSLTD